jgi:hypothetical protein
MNEKDINDTWFIGSDTVLYRELLRYGEDAYDRIILYECTSDEQLAYMTDMFRGYYNTVGADAFYCMLKQFHLPMSESDRKELSRKVADLMH